MSFAGAARSAKIDVFALLRAIAGKLASKVPPGICNVGKMEAYKRFPICHPDGPVKSRD
jgi:hypothetical protein